MSEKIKEIENKAFKLLEIRNQLDKIEEEMILVTGELPGDVSHSFRRIHSYIKDYTKELGLELIEELSKKT
jgi:hypothetical protein